MKVSRAMFEIFDGLGDRSLCELVRGLRVSHPRPAFNFSIQIIWPCYLLNLTFFFNCVRRKRFKTEATHLRWMTGFRIKLLRVEKCEYVLDSKTY